MDEVIIHLTSEEFRLLRNEISKRAAFVLQYPLNEDGDLAKRLADVVRRLDAVAEAQL
jgi:hypothetical protein